MKGPFARGKWLAKNPLLIIFLFFFDLKCSFIKFFCSKKKITSVHKILISNIAHLGDVVLSTSILKALKEKFPHAKIAFLINSSNQLLLKNHPLIDHFHYLDHWKHSRALSSKLEKWRIYRKTLRQVHQEIKEQNYDLAIDLYCFPFNTISILARVGIPQIYGFTSGGGGPLLTQGLPWLHQKQSMLEHFEQLLRLIGIHKTSLIPCLYKTQENSPLSSSYIIFHVGSSTSLKEWEENKWNRLMNIYKNSGHKIVFTGVGSREKKMVERIIQGSEHALDFVGQCSLEQHINLIAHSLGIITVDTSTVHIAASFSKPTIVLQQGISDPHLWLPRQENVVGIYTKLACFPCYKKKGCSSMACIRNIEPEEIFQRASRWLLREQ